MSLTTPIRLTGYYSAPIERFVRPPNDAARLEAGRGGAGRGERIISGTDQETAKWPAGDPWYSPGFAHVHVHQYGQTLQAINGRCPARCRYLPGTVQLVTTGSDNQALQQKEQPDRSRWNAVARTGKA